MPIAETIVGLVGEMIAYVIFELIIEGIGKLIRSIYYGIRKLITGKERDIPELKRIEKRYLLKKFRLFSKVNQHLPQGTKGTVIEVIDERHLLVEFEDSNGMPIVIDGKQQFKIRRKLVVLIRKRRKRE